MKCIKIEGCVDCPYLGSNIYEYWCTKEKDYFKINPNEIIHPDCPLDDYIEGKVVKK